MKKINLFAILLVLLSLSLSAYFYQFMPENMATHWNSNGDVNGYMPKFWGLFLFPILLVFLSILFISIPRVDPMKKNMGAFEIYYNIFLILILLFFMLLQIFVILWNFGFKYNISLITILFLGIIFFYTGFLFEKSKRNWFIGIRTPWTLSSDEVWDKTHKIGGKIFKISGVLVIIGLFFERYSVYFILIPVLLGSLFLIFYSYFEYKKILKTNFYANLNVNTNDSKKSFKK